jgi:hypothetical protein
MTCRFVPPYLLERIATEHPDDDACRCGRRTLVVDESLRSRRLLPPPATGPALPVRDVRDSGEEPFSVYTADNGSSLPGTVARSYGDQATGDEAVDEAYAGVEASLALFREVFGRESYDGRGAPVIATVHYERNYDNAFWDGRQLVFGDGDGKVFDRFTKPVDVLGHEFTHAVTQYTAALTYAGQSGALNESVSDVFASCLKQRLLGQGAADADWLIGAGLFLPSVQGRALRSMAEPGTAYDDPVLGKDPQVGSMSDYVDTDADNGGVHINSGIPNRAFYLAATGLRGSSWETAGAVWYAALTSGIGADTDFAGFADACLAAAERLSPAAVDAVRSAWTEVGVLSGGAGTGTGAGAGGGADTGSDAGGLVAVTRSGGFAGVQQSGEVRLGDDPRTPQVEQLLTRIDLRGVQASSPQPDRFVYAFRIEGREVRLYEQDLTPELQQLAALVLEDPLR